MNKEEYTKYIEDARNRFLLQESTTVKELRGILSRFSSIVSQYIEKFSKNELKKKYYTEILEDIRRMSPQLNQQMLDSIYLGIRNSVFIAEIPSQKILKDMVGRWVSDSEVKQMTATVSDRALVYQLGKTIKGLKVSDRVWKIGEEARRQLQEAIENGIALGRDPRDVARDIKMLLNPGVARPHRVETAKRLGVKEDVPYQATRLAITEMQNAYHESFILQAQKIPGYVGVKWKLSSNHPLYDICDEYAQQDIFPRGQEPAKPHPYCRCYVVPIFDERSIEEVKNELRGGFKKTKKRQGNRPYENLPSPTVLSWLSGVSQYSAYRDYFLASQANRLTPVAKTKDEAEKIAKELGFAKYVNFSELRSEELLNEINEAFARFYQEFPQVKGHLGGIVSAKEFSNITALRQSLKTIESNIRNIRLKSFIEGRSKEEAERLQKSLEGKLEKLGSLIKQCDKEGYFELLKEIESGEFLRKNPEMEDIVNLYNELKTQKELPDFVGIAWMIQNDGRIMCPMNDFYDSGDLLKDWKYFIQSSQTGWSPIHAASPRSVIYHEMGHITEDVFLQLATPVEANRWEITKEELFKKLREEIVKGNLKCLSRYGASHPSEMIAEVVSEVMSAKETGQEPIDFAKKCFEFIKSMYKRLEERGIR